MLLPPLIIGSSAPDFSLPAVDGKTYSLSSFAYKKILVVIFSCNHCPYVQAYETRMKKLQQDYLHRGVQLVAINSNDDKAYPEDAFDRMVFRAKMKQYNFPYLRDETQEVAKEYRAVSTPQVFVFDQKRFLAYTGKIDDNWKEPDKVVSRYLRNAIDEMLAGKPVSVPETYSVGCSIKWKQ